MKKLLLVVIFIFSIVDAPAQTSSTENFISAATCLDAECVKKAWSVQYFDGLGRPKQVVNVKASPTGQDLVTTIPYDGFGRQVDSWLPVPMASLNGGIQSGVESAAVGYYADQSPFTHKHLKNSPLDRVEAVTQTGDAWQGNPITYKYDANKLNEVRKYTATFDYANFAAGIQMVGYYGANQLYKNTVIDEDGNSSVEFKNGEGQTVLVRKVLSLTPNSGVAPDNPELGVQFVDTYYVYNDYNQLAYVLPPLAVAAGNVSTTTLENLCYQYIYDGRNRLVEKKLPGKGWEFMVYDKAGRLILTQDANMRPQQKWLLTKYDKFGRVAYTGITPGGDRATMQDAIKNLIITEERDGTGFTASGMDVLYTKGYYTAMDVVLSVNYYDTYPEGTPFPQGDEIQGVPILKDTFPAGLSVSTQSLPVASYVKNIEDDAWTTSYSFYDRKGRVIGTHAYNHLGGYTKTESVLDFTGVPQHTYTYHKRLRTSKEVKIKERFLYNQYSNALEKHYHEVVGKTPEELLSDNTYDEIGQLITKKVGNNIEEVNYSYNIRRWLTGINLDASNNMQSGKLFNYRIRYNNPEFPNVAAGRYNGNISEVDWKTNGSARKKYGYQYDSLNRLMNGIYQDPDDAFPRTDINSESIEYDLNGNITRLYRNTKHLKTYTARQIDNLTYYYENVNKSNRLQKITDGSGNSSGYEGGGGIISYDDNGNMTTMPDKGITTPMAYNFLNLPSTIVQRGNTTRYHYRADGVKLKKVYTLVNSRGTTVINTEYLDGFQYSSPNADPLRRALEEKDESTVNAATAGEEEAFMALEVRKIAPDNPIDQTTMVLSFFPTAEGYYDFENLRYIYQYKDHLGNVRVSYVKEGSSLKIMDTNDYYPFGMSHLSGTNILTPPVYDPLAIPYNYKYNGKELQETGMYDYGARFYMPDIGRWGVVDELAEDYDSSSPYNYASNNPIINIDPDGRSVNAFTTRYKHNRTGEEVNVNDGIDATVIVGATDFAKAKVYGNYYANTDVKSDYSINEGYLDFYYRTRYGNTINGLLTSLFDSGPDKFRIPTSDTDRMVLLEVPDIGRKGVAKGLIRTLKNTTKPINLPAWKTVIIDIEHIASGHMKGGSRVSSLKTMFPDSMSEKQVENIVREAYKHSTKIKTQGERTLLRGNGIEMWVNTRTKTIESAYPIKK